MSGPPETLDLGLGIQREHARAGARPETPCPRSMTRRLSAMDFTTPRAMLSGTRAGLAPARWATAAAGFAAAGADVWANAAGAMKRHAGEARQRDDPERCASDTSSCEGSPLRRQAAIRVPVRREETNRAPGQRRTASWPDSAAYFVASRRPRNPDTSRYRVPHQRLLAHTRRITRSDGDGGAPAPAPGLRHARVGAPADRSVQAIPAADVDRPESALYWPPWIVSRRTLRPPVARGGR